MVKTQVFQDACHSSQPATLSCEEVLKPSASLTSEVSTRRDAAAICGRLKRSADGFCRLVRLQYQIATSMFQIAFGHLEVQKNIGLIGFWTCSSLLFFRSHLALENAHETSTISRGFQEPAALKLATLAQRPTGSMATPTR